MRTKRENGQMGSCSRPTNFDCPPCSQLKYSCFEVDDYNDNKYLQNVFGRKQLT